MKLSAVMKGLLAPKPSVWVPIFVTANSVSALYMFSMAAGNLLRHGDSSNKFGLVLLGVFQLASAGWILVLYQRRQRRLANRAAELARP